MYSSIYETLNKRVDELEGKAREIVQEHWDFHIRENESRKPHQKGKLNVWVRRRKNNIEIFWTRFRFMYKEGRESPAVKSDYIKKGPGDRYPARRLADKAKPWENDTVQEIEDRMAQIRAELKWINKSRMSLRKAEEVMQSGVLQGQAQPHTPALQKTWWAE